MKFRSLTIVFVLLLFIAVATYAVFELLIKVAIWLALLFVLLLTGGLLLVIVNPFSDGFLKALGPHKRIRT